MSRIFITGSADGLGLLTAKELISLGHQVVLHARNEERRLAALSQAPGAEKVLIADLSDISATKSLAQQVNGLGHFDAIIHNAGVNRVYKSDLSKDGLPIIFAVNSLSTYILTCLIQKPKRFIYLSSAMHLQGDPTLQCLIPHTLHCTYSDSKLHNLIFAKTVARKWPEVLSNAVNPGWVPTKMGGSGAPDSLEKGIQTQVWLAVSNDENSQVSGRYFHHKKEEHYLPAANDLDIQEKFLSVCEEISGVPFPEDKR